MQEKWIKWKPIENLEKKYYIESILDKIDGFEIVLADYNDENKKVLVTFANSVDAYRSTDESFRLSIIHMLRECYGSKFYGEWTFFKVEDSAYIQWLSEQSYRIIESMKPIHFSFIAADSILDVVTTYEPTVQLLNYNNYEL